MPEQEYEKQQPVHLKINRMISLAVLACGWLLLAVVAFFLDFLRLPLALAAVLLGLVVLLVYIYQGAHYRLFSYTMNEDGLYINRGVFWRRQIFIPRTRVQHTDVTRGPLERKHDLATLVVHTAGTRNAVTPLPGILLRQAEELRRNLSFDDSNDAL